MEADGEATFIEGPRPYVVSHKDHRGVLICISILFMLYALMIIGMRLAARIRNMGLDDWLAILATIFAIAHSAVIIGGAANYLGMSYTETSKQSKAAVFARAGDIMFLIALAIAKCAAIWLCRRLFVVNQKAPRIWCEVALGMSVIWCLGSVLGVSFNCSQQKAIGNNVGQCSGLLQRWVIIGILDALIELCVFSLAVIVVWPLQLPLGRKISAITCFFLRLPTILFICLQLYYLSKFLDSPNKGVAITKPIVFRQAELLFSLFSAAVQALNQYLRKFQTTDAVTYGYTPGSYGSAYGLKSISRRRRSPHSIDITRINRNFIPISHNNYKVIVSHSENNAHKPYASPDDISPGRHRSDDMTIRRDVLYEVAYLDGNPKKDMY